MNMKLTTPVLGFVFQDNIHAGTWAGGTNTPGPASVFIPEVWANRAIGKLRAQTCMVRLVSRNFEDMIANEGDTINVQKRGTLVANDKIANTTVTLQNPTGTTIPVVLDNHKEVSFLVEDVAEAQANTSVIDGYVEDGAIVLGEDIDLALLAEYANVSGGNVVTLSAPIDEDDFLSARTILKITGKCGNQPRYCVIRDLAELLTVDKFINRDYVAEGSLAEGSVGRIAGFQVFENNNTIVTTSPSKTHRLAFVQNAIVLVTRRLPNPPAGTGVTASTIVEDGVALRVLYGYNMSYLGMQVTMDILYGTKLLRPEWVCEIS